VLVHGCFWHGHTCRRGVREPEQNGDYWRAKRQRNMARDRANIQALEAGGWKVEVVWECELKTPECVRDRLKLIPAVISDAVSA
jgi:DNA mismatch endonuclease (patch repair protein)